MSQRKRKSFPPSKRRKAEKAISEQNKYKIDKHGSNWDDQLDLVDHSISAWANPYDEMPSEQYCYSYPTNGCFECVSSSDCPVDWIKNFDDVFIFKQRLRSTWESTDLLIQPMKHLGIDSLPADTKTIDSNELEAFNGLDSAPFFSTDGHTDGKAPWGIRSFVKKQFQQGKTEPELEWVNLVVLFSKFWIRNPDDFEGTSKQSLIEHLFAKHPIPDLLYEQWSRLDRAFDEEFLWQYWLIMLGQGLKRSYANPKLSGNFHKHLCRVPWYQLPPHQRTAQVALMATEAKRLGASDRVVLQLARNAAFAENPLKMPWPFLEFFRDTVLWFRVYGDRLTDVQADEILAWAIHMHTERLQLVLDEEIPEGYRHNFSGEVLSEWEKLRKHRRLFRWRGRTSESAATAARRYHDELLAIQQAHEAASLARIAGYYGLRGEITWRRMNWDFERGSEEEGQWSIVELCSLQELINEGATLNHCVATYAGKCIAGTSRIFSFRRKGKQTITIEIHCPTKQVRQARGLNNRAASKEEMEIILQWLACIKQKK
jgi:hypothetical protein